MPYALPTVAEFKTRFDRDFNYAVDQTDKTRVRDLDIQRGLDSANVNFNPGLWASQANFSEGFLLLSAHYLCTNILNSSQGLGGQGSWLVNSKAVGNVSSSFSIPDRILRSPFLSLLSKTLYGAEYLSIIAPLLVGNVRVVCGQTTP